jgi:predicted nucleic acid-binding protein
LKEKEPRYWDSDCFLTWLKGEKTKKSSCQGVIERAEAGKILIVTSALTLAEVIKLKGKPPIPKTDAQKIKDFFMQEFISIRNVDRFIAELGRTFMWHHKKLKHKDAIHIATAATYHITTLDTFDEDLIKLSGKLGNPPIKIGVPDIPYQTNWIKDSNDQANE